MASITVIMIITEVQLLLLLLLLLLLPVLLLLDVTDEWEGDRKTQVVSRVLYSDVPLIIQCLSLSISLSRRGELLFYLFVLEGSSQGLNKRW